MGARRTTSAIFVIVTALLTLASSATAHGNEVHAGHPPAAGATGGGATPGAIPAVNEPVTGGGAAGGTPAPGAQPAAPTNALPPVVNGGVGNAGAAAQPAVAGAGNAAKPVKVVEAAAPAPQVADTSGSTTTTTTATPKLDLETISEPVTAPAPKTVSGGGGGLDVTDAGSTAVPAGAPVVTGGGNLPFTGIEETILLIALAGMFVPIGVLLYCGARRGDRMRYLRQLSAPRFQWAPAPGVRPDANGWPDARA